MKDGLQAGFWIAAAIAGLSVTGCGGGISAADARAARARDAGQEIAIGAAWPWSAHGTMLYGDGLNLAVAEVNERGGIDGRRLKLVQVDDHDSVDQGRMVAQQLSNQPNIVAVIGHLESYVTIPAAAVYDAAGVLTIAPTATDPALTAQGYGHVFRSTFSDREVGAGMARLAARLRYRRAAIYYIRNEYGRSLANAFEETAVERGIVVVDRQSYDPEADLAGRTVEAVVRQWRTLAPDVVFLAGEAAQGGAVIAAMRRDKCAAAVLGGDALGTPDLLAFGAAVEGVIVPSAFHPDSHRPEARQFVDAFARRYSRQPDVAAALAYDAVQVFAHGARAARSIEPDRVARALHDGAGWAGATGSFRFDEHGNLAARPLTTTVVRHGRFEFLSDDPDR